MTTIDRLGITGIRSYGPDHEQVMGPSRRAPKLHERRLSCFGAHAFCVVRVHSSLACQRLLESKQTKERLFALINERDVLLQTITFTPPLTLILGSNGSGKTTIIEVSAPIPLRTRFPFRFSLGSQVPRFRQPLFPVLGR